MSCVNSLCGHWDEPSDGPHSRRHPERSEGPGCFARSTSAFHMSDPWLRLLRPEFPGCDSREHEREYVSYNRRMPDSHHPRRIACLQPSATVILASVGELERVVACTKYCADVVPEVKTNSRNGSRLIIADSWTSRFSPPSLTSSLPPSLIRKQRSLKFSRPVSASSVLLRKRSTTFTAT